MSRSILGFQMRSTAGPAKASRAETLSRLFATLFLCVQKRGGDFLCELGQFSLCLFQNQLRAFHAVIVLRHILLDDQTPVALADLVSFIPGALPPTLGFGVGIELRRAQP